MNMNYEGIEFYDKNGNKIELNGSELKQCLDELLNPDSDKAVIGLKEKEFKAFLQDCNNEIVVESFDIKDGKISSMEHIPSKNSLVIALLDANARIEQMEIIFKELSMCLFGQVIFTALIETNPQNNKVFVLYNKM